MGKSGSNLYCNTPCFAGGSLVQNREKQNTTFLGTYAQSVEIKDNAWIGGGVIILPGVTIGENAVIGAGSIVNLNSEIIGYSAGRNKTADLVKQAFQSVKGNLKNIQIFHTNRGNEFKKQTIDETLKAFEIQPSLSHKGCPYDNPVAEATFKIIKTEFVRNQTFSSLYHIQIEYSDAGIKEDQGNFGQENYFWQTLKEI